MRHKTVEIVPERVRLVAASERPKDDRIALRVLAAGLGFFTGTVIAAALAVMGVL